MENLQTLTPEMIKALTPERILGLPELVKTVYTSNEIKAIKLVLFDFANSKNENYKTEVVESWINNFAEMNLTPLQVIKRIRLAKHIQKYGVTEFAIFMNVDLNEYSNIYKHEKLNQNYIDPEIERLNNEIKTSSHNYSDRLSESRSWLD